MSSARPWHPTVETGLLRKQVSGCEHLCVPLTAIPDPLYQFLPFPCSLSSVEPDSGDSWDRKDKIGIRMFFFFLSLISLPLNENLICLWLFCWFLDSKIPCRLADNHDLNLEFIISTDMCQNSEFDLKFTCSFFHLVCGLLWTGCWRWGKGIVFLLSFIPTMSSPLLAWKLKFVILLGGVKKRLKGDGCRKVLIWQLASCSYCFFIDHPPTPATPMPSDLSLAILLTWVVVSYLVTYFLLSRVAR